MSLAILLVEDEPNLGATLQEYLISIEMPCQWVTTKAEALSFFGKQHFDIVLPDIGLPDGNGLELAEILRQQKKDLLFLFLSAQNDSETKLAGLELGAEDFITKPFALKELILRLRRAIDRHRSVVQQFPEKLVFGKLVAYLNRYELVDANGEILPIGQKECGILKLLLEKQNQVVDRDQIIDTVWGESAFPSNRTVDNYIVKLRKWCDSDNEKIIQINSIRGVGYKLVINQKS